ncbi:hypothetical protein GGI35DRAFT_485921 [Trichoderma velutinum]
MIFQVGGPDEACPTPSRQAPKPQQRVLKERDIPESVKAAHDQLEEVAKEYNKAVQAGNKELAAELRTKLNDLRDKAHEGGHFGSKLQAGDVFEMWIEIHNDTSRWLRNNGGWKHDHGWWESSAVGDIEPGGVAYIHMGWGLLYGLDCIAHFRLDGESRDSWFQWWYADSDPSELVEMWSPSNYERWLDGDKNIGYFYVKD